MSRSQRRAMIDREEPNLSLVRQCALLGISRSSLYYLPTEAGAEDLELMALIDQQYLKTPFYGSRRMTAWLSNHGHQVNRKRVRRLMQLIGLEAIYRRPNTSKPNPGHKVYPYLLKGLEINRVNQVWATDITYIPMARGFLYLVAIMDWHSRYVLAWRLSNTLEVDFCVAALEEALSKGRPQIFNTDQGSQFTSEAFTSMLLAQGVQVSMDGRGRCMDNVFVERLWRSIKYEEVYLKAYQNGTEARKGIGAYLAFYNQERPHQALGYRSPGQVFQAVSPQRCLLEHPRALPSDEGLRDTPAWVTAHFVGEVRLALDRQVHGIETADAPAAPYRRRDDGVRLRQHRGLSHLRREERRLRRLLGRRCFWRGHAACGLLRLRQRRVRAHLRGEERRLRRLLGRR